MLWLRCDKRNDPCVTVSKVILHQMQVIALCAVVLLRLQIIALGAYYQLWMDGCFQQYFSHIRTMEDNERLCAMGLRLRLRRFHPKQ